MVGLLGTRDELLHVIERELSADVHVRGNEITVSGSPAETELVGRLFSELLELQRKGAELSPDALLKLADAGRPRGILVFNAGTTDDRLREEDCRANVIHVAPTRSMLADALAQYLV